jgi:hypothetical protein
MHGRGKYSSPVKGVGNKLRQNGPGFSFWRTCAAITGVHQGPPVAAYAGHCKNPDKARKYVSVHPIIKTIDSQ